MLAAHLVRARVGLGSPKFFHPNDLPWGSFEPIVYFGTISEIVFFTLDVVAYTYLYTCLNV